MESTFYSSPPFNISRKKLIHTSMPSHHYHDAYEILYFISGEIYYFVEDKTYPIVSGSLLFININDLHKLVNSSGKPFERITLLFKQQFFSNFMINNDNFDLFSSFTSSSNILRLKGSEQSFIENLFEKMIHEESRQPPGFVHYQQLLLIELLIFIKRKVDAGESSSWEEPHRTHKKVFEIIDYIHSHYNQRLTLACLSKRFFISASYFSRIFKDTTGFTFIEYLNNVRIKEARLLLLESKFNMTQISESVGFDSLTHFGRTFKEITGLPPLQYRRLQRERNT
ncbi:AraC family transcriptional regulator [Paenibacillus sp. SYP-B3998]|uniref:AraC family transcriptional regulator n=1 Tax=Paenibacillus sp. SYP-B3998 TaxID=2678564 RepID=A0A6G4A1T9_9BACL|nr:AraC family transcriptional regulator [Paenibacillus sp. SYP-B3998]NEW08352.1 AraC family transcriptional regulator [Paenibacillus sp. SYP-B3998]